MARARKEEFWLTQTAIQFLQSLQLRGTGSNPVAPTNFILSARYVVIILSPFSSNVNSQFLYFIGWVQMMIIRLVKRKITTFCGHTQVGEEDSLLNC